MPAISKSWVAIADTAVDPDSPLDAALMTGIRDDLVHLREWLGAGYVAGAVQDHNHDGVNSAAIEIGPNWLRNGSFENDLAGWTATTYTGGTVAINTANETIGGKCLAITSTSTANGGGNVLSDEFIEVVAGQTRQFMMTLKATAAGVPMKAEVVWYNDAQAQISATSLINITTSPTSDRLLIRRVAAPATAKYCKVRLELPTGGSATGTAYFDAVSVGMPAMLGGYRLITASGTFSDAWGDVYVEVQAAGGGAGAAQSGGPVGGSGGNGGFAEGPVTTSGDVSVTIGAAGAGVVNSSPNTQASAGGSSSFGAFMSATGGTGGYGGGHVTYPGVPGVNGIGTGGAINVRDALLGRRGVITLNGVNSVAGDAYGGGASETPFGGTRSGANGSQGAVAVRW